MSDWPGLGAWPAKDAIGPSSPIISIGERLVACLAPVASTAWPAANRALYIPFAIGSWWTAKKIVVENGATVNGNVDAGIYDAEGNRLVSIGSTAMSGSNSSQTFDITDTVLPPGRYFLGFACSSGTAAFFGWGPAAGLVSSFGVLQQATAFALPATATFAANTGAFNPVVYILGRTLV